MPAELKKPHHKCWAGAKLKARTWRYQPFLTSTHMGAVNTLANKCIELEALVKKQQARCDCGLVFQGDLVKMSTLWTVWIEVLEKVKRSSACGQQVMQPQLYHSEGEALLSGYWSVGSHSSSLICRGNSLISSPLLFMINHKQHL